MLATIMLDVYKQSEARDVREALKRLFNERNSAGWSSSGLYAYWDYETRKLLYIGLAKNLSNRFAEHNGLVSCKESSCKVREIRAYFSEHETLGFSIFAQSALMNFPSDHFLDDSQDVITRGEGQAIEAYLRKFDVRPPWNKIGGSVAGQQMTELRTSALHEVLSGERDSLLVARRSVRWLAYHPTHRSFEEAIHSARMWATMEQNLGRDANILHWIFRLRSEPRRGADVQTIDAILAGDYLRMTPLPRRLGRRYPLRIPYPSLSFQPRCSGY